MEPDKLFDIESDECTDIGIIKHFEKDGFEYLEKVIERANSGIINEISLNMLDTYCKLFIDDNRDNFITYYKNNLDSKIWEYYHNHNIVYITLKYICTYHKYKNDYELYHLLFKDINTSKY